MSLTVTHIHDINSKDIELENHLITSFTFHLKIFQSGVFFIPNQLVLRRHHLQEFEHITI